MNTPGDAKLALEARNVFKTYRLGRARVPVLRGASMQVRTGEWIAVLGASGSGKSTLLHLLGGLDRPDVTSAREPGEPEGSVWCAGRCISRVSARELDRYRSEHVGLVFQFYHLLPELSVIDNVLIPAMARLGRLGFMRRAAEIRSRASGLLGAFGLSDRIRHRPVELSGGERQRVAIARALINDPPVLLADEPTGNLDRKTGASILDELARLRAQRHATMVMVTHDPAVAERADRIVRIEDGRILDGSEPE